MKKALNPNIHNPYKYVKFPCLNIIPNRILYEGSCTPVYNISHSRFSATMSRDIVIYPQVKPNSKW